MERQLEWVYGYHGHSRRNNVYYTGTSTRGDEIVYFTDRIGVVLDRPEKKQRFYQEHTETIMCLALHCDKRCVATGQVGTDPFICVWNTSTMTTLAKLQGGHKKDIAALAFSGDGKLLASVGLLHSDALIVWDWRNKSVLTSVSPYALKGKTFAIQFNPIPERLELVTCGTKHIKLWNMYQSVTQNVTHSWLDGKEGYIKPALKVRSSEFLCVAFSFERDVSYVGTSCGHICKWKHQSLHDVQLKHKNGISTIHVSISGVATGSLDGTVRLFTHELQPIDSVDVKEHVRSVCWEDTRMLIGTESGRLMEYGVHHKVTTVVTQGPAGIKTWALAAHPHESVFGAASDDKLIWMWDSSKRALLGCWSTPDHICSLAFSPDGAHLAAGRKDGSFLVYNTKDFTRRLIQDTSPEKRQRSSKYQIKYSSDGQYFVVRSDAIMYIYLVTGDQYQHVGTCEGKLVSDLNAFLGVHERSSESVPFTVPGEKSVITGNHLISLGETECAIYQWKLSSGAMTRMTSERDRLHHSNDGSWETEAGKPTCTSVIPQWKEYLWPSESVESNLESRVRVLEKELKKKEEDNKSLKANLTAVMMAHEGNVDTIPSADLKSDYQSLFTTEVYRVVKDLPQRDQLAAEEFLCKMFQYTYDHISGKVKSNLVKKLEALFAVSSTECSEKQYQAYRKLLRAAGYGRNCQPTAEDVDELLRPWCYPGLPREKVKVWVVKSWQLAWNLVTAAPPMIASSPEYFDPDIQDLLHIPPPSTNPVYSQPVLFTDCSGRCSLKGEVRVALNSGQPTVMEGTTSAASSNAMKSIDLTLSLENIMGELEDVIDWYALGSHLMIKSEVLDDISGGGANWPEHCIRNMIKYWLSTGRASWMTLADSLVATREVFIAEKIKKDYCCAR